MSSYAELLIDRFRAKGLLIDTNLLLLHVVGRYDERIIEKSAFNRLAAYSLGDLQLLRGLLSLFPTHVTTAHVLAEVSNWIGYLGRHQSAECLGQLANTLGGFIELEFRSLEVARDERFGYLGLTDTAIARVAGEYLVLTDDARFVTHLSQMGRDALNINHLRQELWLRD